MIVATTVAAAFNEFNTRVTPGERTWNKVYARRDAVVSVLKKAFPLESDISYRSSKIIGSLGRNTAGTPVADIDLLVHLSVDMDLWDREYKYSSSKFLYRVRRSLDSESMVQKIGARGQAVRLFYADGLEVDVAPVEKYQDGSFAIPDGSGNWITTDPGKHETYLDRRNGELVGDLKKVIRFAKQWNKAHSSRLKSFHLEMLVARTFGTMDNNSREALKLFFDYNHKNLSVQDPAGYSGDLANGISWATRSAVNDSLSRASYRAGQALVAENRGNHREAIRLWGIILGDRFPVYG
jgi:hypothetical protein